MFQISVLYVFLNIFSISLIWLIAESLEYVIENSCTLDA